MFKKYIFITILLFSANSYAALNLELIKGIDKPIPLAIMSFSEHHNIAKIISANLQNSGRFRVKNVNAPQQLSYGLHAVNYAYWAQQKMHNVVLGSMTSLGHKYKVSFRLLDVYGKAILLNKSYTIPKQQLGSLAHHISDLIYQQLTGIRGIFSTKIAYVLVQRNSGQPTTYSLIVADADGHNPKQLLTSSEPIMSPAWSANGKNIAYVSFAYKKPAIYIQDLATGKRSIVANFPGINGALAWSPDGKKLAVVLTKGAYPKIYRLTLATKQLQQITFGWCLDTEPNWAPDGRSIIFTSNRRGSVQIYRLNLVTNKVQRITYQGSYNASSSFAPDGKSILMLHKANGMFNIAKQDLITGKVAILTNAGLDKSPSMAPNGDMVIYATYYNGHGVLGEVSIDGKVKLRLLSQQGDVQEPAWSPFLN